MAIRRLKRRPEFLQVASSGQKTAMPGLVLQARARNDADPIRVGFTASRKVGGAVQRNRAKRRLRAAVEQVLGTESRAGRDYVVIARAETIRRPFSLLVDDLGRALTRVDREKERR